MSLSRRKSGIIFMMHCESNTGYAIGNLEQTFFEAALRAGYEPASVFFSYPSIEKGKPQWMGEGAGSYVKYCFRANDASDRRAFSRYIEANDIQTAFVFDLQPHNPVNGVLRTAGVRRIFSYWGAPMSGLNTGVKLWAKRVEVAIRRSGPDEYIFESEAMRELAVFGRGIPAQKCRVVPTGVDTDRFRPSDRLAEEVRRSLQVPLDRKVFVYTGHMEERKGVHVIVKAMDHLVGVQGRRDIHFLALGNRPGEEQRFFDMLGHGETSAYLTFGGYRPDVEEVFKEAYAGVVASTGWDSWPMSVLEMASSGLPLLVSDFQGLKEFVINGETGQRFPPGDHIALAAFMRSLVDEPGAAQAMGRASRERVLTAYSREHQVKKLAEVIS